MWSYVFQHHGRAAQKKVLEGLATCCQNSSVTHSKPTDKRRSSHDDDGGITLSKPNRHRDKQTGNEGMTDSKPSRDRGKSGQSQGTTDSKPPRDRERSGEGQGTTDSKPSRDSQGTTDSKPNSGRDSTDGVVSPDDLDFGTKPVKCFSMRVIVRWKQTAQHRLSGVKGFLLNVWSDY